MGDGDFLVLDVVFADSPGSSTRNSRNGSSNRDQYNRSARANSTSAATQNLVGTQVCPFESRVLAVFQAAMRTCLPTSSARPIAFLSRSTNSLSSRYAVGSGRRSRRQNATFALSVAQPQRREVETLR